MSYGPHLRSRRRVGRCRCRRLQQRQHRIFILVGLTCLAYLADLSRGGQYTQRGTILTCTWPDGRLQPH